MRISDTFKSRAENVTGSLTSMHHDAMDILYAANQESFTLDRVVALLEEDGTLMHYEIIAENKSRIRLISARMLDQLLETKLITQKTPGRNGSFCWNLEK